MGLRQTVASEKVEENPQNQTTNKTPRLFFLSNFSLILNSSFPSWGHLSYRGAGLCTDKHSTREAEKICPLLHQWRENVCLVTSGEADVFLLDLVKKFEFHFTVGTLPVVWVCRHLQHHVVFDTKLSFACAEAWQSLNLISLLQLQPRLGKWSVSTGRAQDFGSNTGCAWPRSRKDTFILPSQSLFCGSTLQPVTRRKLLV